MILDIVEALDFPSNSADDSSVLPVFHRFPFSVIWEAPPATLTSRNHGFRIMSWSIASCFSLLLEIDSNKHEGERKKHFNQGHGSKPNTPPKPEGVRHAQAFKSISFFLAVSLDAHQGAEIVPSGQCSSGGCHQEAFDEDYGPG